MFTVYTRSPQKKITTITQYLYGTKKYRWLNDVCQWYQYKQDTQWSKYPLQQGIIQQAVAGSCITSYLSRAKLDQIQYLQGNQAIAKQLYDKDIQGTYQTQEQRKDCQCGSLYRVYVKRTAQWNSDRCKWKQPSYQIYYTVDEQVSDQASYERDQLGCITKIQQSLYMGRTVSSYRLQEFGGLQNLTVFPQQTMQQIQFMAWVPIQQEENCLCSPVVYNFYRYRKASLKDTAWTTDSLTYQCSTDDLLVFIKGYKQQDQPCYTRSQERQFIQSVKRKLSQQDIQDIKQQLAQQDIQNPPTWSALKQPATCSSVYRIDRHYLFDCQKVEWVQTYTDDYGLTNVIPDFSLSDSNYVRTYYQNDNQGNLDYQTAYMQYVGQQAVLHVRIAKSFKNNQATANDATTKRYFNPKKLLCCSSQDPRGTSLIKDSQFLIGIVAGSNCISLFKHNASYFIEVWSTYNKKYFFSIIIGKIKGVPICMNHNKYQYNFGSKGNQLYPTGHVFLLTSEAVYAIDIETGLCQLRQQLPQIFTSVPCTLGSCFFIATTIKKPNKALYYWGSLSRTNYPYISLSSVPTNIYRLFQCGTKNSLQSGRGFVLCVDTQDITGAYSIYTADMVSLNDDFKELNIFQGNTYSRLESPQLPSLNAYTDIQVTNPGVAYSSKQDDIFITYSVASSVYPALQSKASKERSAHQLQGYLPYRVVNGTHWMNTAVPDIQKKSSMYLLFDQWDSGMDHPSKPEYLYTLVKTTNKQLVFCKQQLFQNVLLLRPTEMRYDPAIIYNPDEGTFGSDKRFYNLERTQLSTNQQYIFKINFRYVWDSNDCSWGLRPITITPVSEVGQNTEGYSQDFKQYTGQIYAVPGVQLQSIYFKKLKPATSCAIPTHHTVYSSPTAVFVAPRQVQTGQSVANTSFCTSAYGAWFTGRTTTQTVAGQTRCYCLVYTDQTKTQIQKLQGQCVYSTDVHVKYVDTVIIQRPVSSLLYDPVYVYNCLVQSRGELITFYSCRQNMFCKVYWLNNNKVNTISFTMQTSFAVSATQKPTVFTYIQYWDKQWFNIYAVCLSQDYSQIQIKVGKIDAGLAHIQAPKISSYNSYYKGQNPSNMQWKAMTRQFSRHVCLMSTTHIGFLEKTATEASYSIKTIALDQQYFDQIDTITAPWLGIGSIFTTLTKNKKQAVFIGFNGTTYVKYAVNVDIPTDQIVHITGVSSYDTQQIGVVLGPYTICTIDYSNFKPYQRVTLVKIKLQNGQFVVSWNEQIIITRMYQLNNSRPCAYNSCSGITYSFANPTETAQNAVEKSYDKDMVVLNMNNSQRKYVVDIKTGTHSVAKFNS